MPYPPSAADGSPYHVVGVGFGPSNLALAVALAEEHGRDGLRTVFLERQERFGWHQGLLLEDATMQVPFLKDLATIRNPTSRFSFLVYLHEHGRLIDFINHKALFPTRVEYHDYLQWAAAQFSDVVRYGLEVVDVIPVRSASGVDAWDVVTADGDGRRKLTYRTRNVVLATGLVPVMPDGVARSDRVWHSSELLFRLAEWPAGDRQRFAVVGAGQSAAEVTAHLHRRFPTAEVYAIMSRYGYSPADDSPFANRVFDPSAVDDFFGAPIDVQQRFYNYHANTNYSVVDVELIDELYRRHYQERVTGRRRMHLMNMSTVASVTSGGGKVTLVIHGPARNNPTDLTVDAVIFATGYRSMDLTHTLGDALGCCEVDARGLVRVERDYRVATMPGVRAGIYLQGGTEHSHGLSSSLLSNIAVRAGEICHSIATRTGSEVPAPVEAHALALVVDRTAGT
jgi:L-ornithine N5-monooxygenase